MKRVRVPVIGRYGIPRDLSLVSDMFALVQLANTRPSTTLALTRQLGHAIAVGWVTLHRGRKIGRSGDSRLTPNQNLLMPDG